MSEPILESNFFLFTPSPTIPTHTASPIPSPFSTCSPHHPHSPFFFRIDSWMGPGHGKCLGLCLTKLHQRRENEKETQEEGNWERKQKQTKKGRSKGWKEFSALLLRFTPSPPAEKSSLQTPPTQSPIPLIRNQICIFLISLTLFPGPKD